jgi:hypothetical protein
VIVGTLVVRLGPRTAVCPHCLHPKLDGDGDETHDGDGFCLVELPGSRLGARLYCGCEGAKWNAVEEAAIEQRGFDGFSRYGA